MTENICKTGSQDASYYAESSYYPIYEDSDKTFPGALKVAYMMLH